MRRTSITKLGIGVRCDEDWKNVNKEKHIEFKKKTFTKPTLQAFKFEKRRNERQTGGKEV